MTSAGKGPESKFGWGELPLFFSQGSSPAIKSLLVLVYSFFFFLFSSLFSTGANECAKVDSQMSPHGHCRAQWSEQQHEFQFPLFYSGL